MVLGAVVWLALVVLAVAGGLVWRARSRPPESEPGLRLLWDWPALAAVAAGIVLLFGVSFLLIAVSDEGDVSEVLLAALWLGWVLALLACPVYLWWRFHPYRCPTCRTPLERTGYDLYRYPCRRCGVEWAVGWGTAKRNWDD